MKKTFLAPLALLLATTATTAPAAEEELHAPPLRTLWQPHHAGPLELEQDPIYQATTSIEAAMFTLQELFPEAYTQFMQVSFEFQDLGEIWPATAHFFIPARYFPEPLSDALLQQRAEELVARTTYPGMAACPAVELDPTSTAAWLDWEDKQVRRVTIRFMVGC